MNKEQVFLDAINKCEDNQLTTSFIGKVAREDKTNSLKKYMNSFGVLQLANHLQELGRTCQPPKELIVALQNNSPSGNKTGGPIPARPDGVPADAAYYGVDDMGRPIFKSNLKTSPSRRSSLGDYSWSDSSLTSSSSTITLSGGHAYGGKLVNPYERAKAKAKADAEAKLRSRNKSKKTSEAYRGKVLDDVIASFSEGPDYSDIPPEGVEENY